MPILPIFTQKRYLSTFSIKILSKGLLIAFFLLMPIISLGATIFTDDFNSYNNGDLKNQGDWIRSSGLWNVQDGVKFEGAKAISSNVVSLYYKDGNSIQDGKFSFYFYKTANSNQLLRFEVLDIADDVMVLQFTSAWQFKFFGNGDWITYGNYTADEWHNVRVEWYKNIPLNKVYARYKLDTQNWSDWYEGANPLSPNRIQLRISTGTTGYTYIDYIAETEFQPPCETYETKEDCENAGYCFWWERFNACLPEEEITQTWIYPEIPNPDEEIETYATSTDLIIKGKIKIGFEDGQKWAYTDFYAYFTNLKTGKTFTFHKELEEVEPNEIIDYEENLGAISDFLTDWEQGNFRVDYGLLGKGYLKFWERNWIIVGDGVIAVSEIKELPFDIVEIPELELENCEGLGTIEAWLCDIKNFFKGIFYPTSAKIQELKYNVDFLKEKAPINYLNATKDFISDVKTEITIAETDFKIFGEEGTLSFAGLDFDVENGGGTENFISFIRKFFTFILLFGLMIWGIKFIRKFWK